MGAGISSLSKICLVERRDPFQPTPVKGAFRLDYTFVGLGIESDEVDVAGNCGNMSSAIGPYAYNSKLLPRSAYRDGDGEVTVEIRNTNTGKLLNSTFNVVGGQAAVHGDYVIDGVAGTSSRIKLEYLHPFGSKTGKLLPTGRPIDVVSGYKVSCVDGANPAVFIRADHVHIDGTILPADFNKMPEKLAILERVRREAAVAMGMAISVNDVPRTVPKIGIVSQSSMHRVLSGAILRPSQVDLVVRFISDTQPHRAIPLTMALTTAVAARTKGTIVEQLLAPEAATVDAITIGHASGTIQVNATFTEPNQEPSSATVYRTAKRIFEGDVYYTDNDPSSSPKDSAVSSSAPKNQGGLGLAFVLEQRNDASSGFFHEKPEMVVETSGNRRRRSKH
ncbi:PrpF protein [Dendryphion nanum]|uniref:PrpF protein n=1 Tax=Dendryphion nanum TaxID=256645 RepID=A0A9P9IIW9_9PLEO|nr:PrpF protein [Dendryphion nanum]